MNRIVLALLLSAAALPAHSQQHAVVFLQPGFPTVASEPIDRSTLSSALAPLQPTFADLAALNQPGSLAQASVLVLPYGSAVPADAWKSISAYLNHGGNLVVLGGQPLQVPVSGAAFTQSRPQDSYAESVRAAPHL